MNGIGADTFGLRINEAICFSDDKNKPHQRTINRQLKLVRSFAPQLKQLLKPDEEILLTVRACSPMSWFEQLTTGWMIYYLKRCVLIFTNKRILHFPTRMNFAPKPSVAQILYGDIAEAKVGTFFGRVLNLKYRTGKKESFSYVESPEFKKLKALLPTLPKESHPSEVSERHHLCPRCQARLLSGKFTCPNCQLEFKDGERAIKLSILYPGGGYFYTGHPFLGLGDAVLETVLLIWLIVGAVDFFTGDGGPEGWAAVIIPTVALIFEKTETIFHAKHYVNEYIPVDANFAPATASSFVKAPR